MVLTNRQDVELRDLIYKVAASKCIMTNKDLLGLYDEYLIAMVLLTMNLGNIDPMKALAILRDLEITDELIGEAIKVAERTLIIYD